jgi:hypothetical protein
MNALLAFFQKLFGRKNSTWDTAFNQKPSTAGDDFRKSNET